MSYSIVFALPPAVRVAMAALTDVAVMTGPRQIPAGGNQLAVQEMRASAARPLTGGWRRETGSFVLRTYVEVKGAGEAAIDAARTAADDVLHRACDILEADKTIGGVVRFCDVEEIAEDDQSFTDHGHAFAAHATISFTADVDPGA